MITYIFVSFLNVFFHVVKTLMIVKASKLVASTANCFCYTFSAVVVKFIAESDLMVAILIAAFTNFAGCYAGMYVFEKFKKQYQSK